MPTAAKADARGPGEDLKGRYLLVVGGSAIQIPAIRYAQQSGFRVVACDMNPEAAARQVADNFHPVNTTDFDGLVKLARQYDICGVFTYATDPSAPGVAHVASTLGLPGNSLEAVNRLCRKDLFRPFQKAAGYFCPDFRICRSLSEFRDGVRDLGLPVVVKPNDSSGSKGVAVLRGEDEETVAAYYKSALSFSRSELVIVEQFVTRKGPQIAGDGFMVNGRCVWCLADEHFSRAPNPLMHMGETFPTSHDAETQTKVRDVLEGILTACGYNDGAFNIDVAVTEKGEIFVIELGPRNGGNLIPEVVRLCTGVDLIRYTVDCAIGLALDDLVMREAEGFYASYVINSKADGIYRGVSIDDCLKDNIIETRLYQKPGNRIYAYTGSHRAVGAMLLKYDSQAEMLGRMAEMQDLVVVRSDPL